MLKPSPELSLVLAPMEGVTDAPMRALLTEVGNFDFCVSEFLRISQALLPNKVFLKHVPELKNGGRTPTDTPVLVQLLGGNPELLAESALQAIELGALGIDLNFGCPAPTVNRHDGGATLLKYPERIEKIVSAVRRKVPKEFPVSAKLRLGWDSKDSIFENAKRAEQGGASWITVHARTKEQGYAPPADWEIVGAVMKTLSVPIILNGDLWNVEDWKRARDLTGAHAFMLGRGSVADPCLSRNIRTANTVKPSWNELIPRFVEVSEVYGYPPGYFVRRIKQWLRLASNQGKFGEWESLKHLERMDQVLGLLT